MNGVFYIFSFFVLAKSAQVIRPRGVPLSKGSLYNPTKPFICFDGSAKIPFEQINDDYCDCKDGSDEPGTAACMNGSFYCNNIGHQPKNIPSSWVNDGVCDCCDTSDEYGSNASCINDCEELGEAARIEAEMKQREQLKGYDIRQQLAEEGLKLKKDKQVRLSDLGKENELAETARQEKLSLKEKVEIPEKEALEKYKEIEEELKKRKEEQQKIKDEIEAKEAFSYLDNNQDGVITIEELRSRSIFDSNKDGDVSEDEAKFYLNQAESINMADFLESGWALVKPIYRYGKNMFTPPTTEVPLEEDLEIENDNIEKQKEINLDNADYEESEDEQDNDELTDDDDVPDDTDYEDEDANLKTTETATEEETIQYDEETQILVDIANAARVEYNLEDKKVKDIVKETKLIESELQKDYGPNEEFRPLAGNCFEFDEREYTYKLCPFDYASQKQRHGHGETRLGTWGEWTGTEDAPYTSMKYIGGQGCWNGPQRSTEVKLSCSTEVALTAVSEPNRCEYLFLFSTPSVCTQPSQEESIHQHIEL